MGIDAALAHAAARKYLVPERMLVVAVGDRQKIEADLKKLNLGAAEYRDVDGNLIRPSR
jgi:zinc protease